MFIIYTLIVRTKKILLPPEELITYEMEEGKIEEKVLSDEVLALILKLESEAGEMEMEASALEAGIEFLMSEISMDDLDDQVSELEQKAEDIEKNSLSLLSEYLSDDTESEEDNYSRPPRFVMAPGKRPRTPKQKLTFVIPGTSGVKPRDARESDVLPGAVLCAVPGRVEDFSRIQSAGARMESSIEGSSGKKKKKKLKEEERKRKPQTTSAPEGRKRFIVKDVSVPRRWRVNRWRRIKRKWRRKQMEWSARRLRVQNMARLMTLMAGSGAASQSTKQRRARGGPLPRAPEAVAPAAAPAVGGAGRSKDP